MADRPRRDFMIGRGLVVFRHADGRNDLHFVDPWGMAVSVGKDDFEETIKKAARDRKWKPEATVDDAEVEAIKKATNCLGKEGHHQYASDCVRVFNVSEDELVFTIRHAAELYVEIMREAKKKARVKIREAMKKHGLPLEAVREEVSRLRKE